MPPAGRRIRSMGEKKKKEKIFDKTDGEYIDFIEIKE